MERDETPPPRQLVATNDSPLASIDSAKIDDALARIARLIGRQIARESFKPGRADNDNGP